MFGNMTGRIDFEAFLRCFGGVGGVLGGILELFWGVFSDLGVGWGVVVGVLME